jgi:hypothetical protein
MGKSMKVHYKKKPTKTRISSGKKHMRKNTKRRSLKQNKKRKMSRKVSRKVNRKFRMRGGSVNGPVGYSWNGGDVGTWPGVQASQGMNTNGATMSNHFSLSPNGIVVGGIEPAVSTSDDQLINSSSTSMSGGKKKNKRMRSKKNRRSKKQRGGLGFQSIVNLGRGLEAGAKGVYYNFAGQSQPNSQNPYPTQGQYAHSNNTHPSVNMPIDYRNMYIEANNTVAQI